MRTVKSVDIVSGKVVVTYADGTTEDLMPLSSSDGGITPEELAEINRRLDVLTSEVSSLSTLEEGSTTGDAELINGRIGYNGTVYQNIGTAIREQINDLHNKKMEYYILTFDGTSFKHDGTTLTFAQIREKCLDEKHFVYALYDSQMYIPQWVSASNVMFDSSYIRNDVPQMHRIGISSSGAINKYDFNLAKESDLNSVASDLSGLSYLAVGKNLVGTEGGKPYACFIPNGSKVTFSTSDGSLKSGDALYVHFLDSNKTQIDSSTFTNGSASRTVVAHADVYYVRLNRSYEVPIQVEIGEAPTEYNEYIPNQRQSIEDAKEAASNAYGDITFVSYQNVYVKKTGEISNWSGHSRTAFIECSGYDFIRVISSEASEYNCFYDADRNFVSNFAIVSGEKDIPVPNTAKYVMLSTTTANMANLRLHGIASTKIGDLVAIKSNGSAFWSGNNNDGNFTITGDVYVFGDGSDSIIVSKSSILAKAQDSSLTTVENDVIKGKAFVIEFNYATKDVSIKPYYNYHTSDDCIILFAHYYNSNYCGALVDYMIRKKTLEVDGYAIPEYWESELNTSIETITNLDSESGISGDRLVFFTDYHAPNNSGFSHNLIKQIVNKCGIGKVVFGGDILDDRTSIALAIKDIRDFKDLFHDVNMYSIIGNHEYNNPSSSESKLDIMPTTSQIFNIMCKDKEHEYGNIGSNGEYWFDNPVQKIRYFVLPSNYHSWIIIGTRKWFAEQVALTPNGYTIIVLSHVGFKIENGQQILTDQFSVIASIMDAVKTKTSVVADSVTYDYSNMNVNVACALTGHLHKDSYVKTDGGIPIFGTTCDSMREDATGLNREVGTYTEHAFDIVDIDTKNRKVSLIRVGAGADRSATY